MIELVCNIGMVFAALVLWAVVLFHPVDSTGYRDSGRLLGRMMGRLTDPFRYTNYCIRALLKR